MSTHARIVGAWSQAMLRRDKLITGQCAATGFASGMEQSKKRKSISTHARIVVAWSQAMSRRDKLITGQCAATGFTSGMEQSKKSKMHEYTCPHCGGLVASNVTTGQTDHRTVCGNRFCVRDGTVQEKQKHEYTCPHCGGLVASIMLRRDKLITCTVCGDRFCVRDGTVKEKKKHKYTCPHCGGLVASNVTTGQIDHRTVCGNRFYVTAGKVKDSRPKEERAADDRQEIAQRGRCAPPEPRAHSLRNSAHSLARSPERLKRPESRSWLLQRPVWQNHWQGSRGLRGLKGLRRLKGSFGPLEKKDLARQSPEPTVCATPPTVSHRSTEPTV